MKIENMQTLPADPMRFERTAARSEATAPVSTFREGEVRKPEEGLKKDPKSVDEIYKAVEDINNQLQIANRAIQFSIDENSNDIVVKVVDKESGEVVRQLPPESILRLREHMAEISGLLVEEKV